MSKEIGEQERGARGGVDRRSDNVTSVDVEIRVDPHRRRRPLTSEGFTKLRFSIGPALYVYYCRTLKKLRAGRGLGAEGKGRNVTVSDMC